VRVAQLRDKLKVEIGVNMEETYAYARVSTQEQALNSRALEQQLDRLKQAGATKIFADVISGDKAERPEFIKLMGLVRQEKVKILLATRWDRLTRNEELYLELKKILQNYGITLKLLDQGVVDFTTAAGELSADMQAIFAVHERRMLRERVKNGFKHRRKRLAASARAPFGYTVIHDKYELNTKPCICLLDERPANYLKLYAELDNSEKLENRSKAQIAREMFELLLQLHKPRKVLSYLYEKYGVMTKKGTNSAIDDALVLPQSTTHFREWLLNPVHQGHTAYFRYQSKGNLKPKQQWELHRDTHPNHKLIDEAEAEEIKDLLKINSKKVGVTTKTFYLSGLVFCGQCGGKCMLRRNAGYGYYACRHANLGCDNVKGTRIEKIDQAIINALFGRAIDLSQTAQFQPDLFLQSNKLQEMKEQLAHLEQIPKIEDNRLLSNAKSELIKSIENETKRLETNISLDETEQQIINHPMARNLSFWYSLTEEEREVIYYKLVERVSILSKEVLAVSLHV
jgi:site-specific DNA recombinase